MGGYLGGGTLTYDRYRNLLKDNPTVPTSRYYLPCGQRLNKSGHWNVRASFAFHPQL